MKGFAARNRTRAPGVVAGGEKDAVVHRWKPGEYLVHPVHGVGQVTGFEKYHVAGEMVDMIVLYFRSARMTERVPVAKTWKLGLRPTIARKRLQHVYRTLSAPGASVRGRPWVRRLVEYETKLHSADPVLIAEILRDLRRSLHFGDASLSETEMYRTALEKLVQEVAVVEQVDIAGAHRLVAGAMGEVTARAG